MRHEERVAIVGAGYAGMSAAAELAARAIPVTVFEAARTLGGRARTTEIEGHALDNGQHILIGAYSETLRLMQLIGADPHRLLRRERLTLRYPGELHLSAPALPAPLHLAAALLFARGWSLADRIAALRFVGFLKAHGFRLDADRPLDQLLAEHAQPERLRRHLWEPLCVAALNTPAADASSQVFANVLRDSLGARRDASDLLLPVADLSRLLPEPAAAYVAARGGQVQRGVRIAALRRDGSGYFLDGYGPFRAVILAVAPYHLARLTQDLPELAALRACVAGFRHEPILTAYLAYPEHVRLGFPMLGHADGYLQWLFDRGQLGGPRGLLAAVISARGRHQELAPEELLQRLHVEAARLIPGLPSPHWSRLIVERRATFACTPDLLRPPTATPLRGLFLAGDYVASDYPGTIESAVRSGVAAARAVAGTK